MAGDWTGWCGSCYPGVWTKNRTVIEHLKGEVVRSVLGGLLDSGGRPMNRTVGALDKRDRGGRRRGAAAARDDGSRRDGGG